MKAAAAGAVLGVLLCAPPIVLVVLSGWPWEAIRRAVQWGLLGRPALACGHGLVAVAWLWWASVLVQTVETVRSVRAADRVRRQEIRSSAATAPQVMRRRPFGVRALITTLLVAPLSTPLLTAAHATQAAAAPMVPLAADTSLHATTQQTTTAASVRPEQAGPRRPADEIVEVQAWGPTTTLWGLAEDRLGDGTRWREIWDLNAGRQQADGAIMRSPNLLVPGWTVLVPATSQPQPSGTGAGDPVADDAEAGGGRASLRYTIAAGDRLGDIAQRFLGDADAYPRIQHDNADVIADPDHIEAGDTITLPAAAHEGPRADHARGSTTPRTPANTQSRSSDPDASRRTRDAAASGTPENRAVPASPPQLSHAQKRTAATDPSDARRRASNNHETTDPGPDVPTAKAPSPSPPEPARTGVPSSASPSTDRQLNGDEDADQPARLPAWAAPAGATGLVLALALGARRRRRRASTDEEAGADAWLELLSEDPDEMGDGDAERDRTAARRARTGPTEPAADPALDAEDSDDILGPEHADAAIDAARLYIQRSAQALWDRSTTPQGFSPQRVRPPEHAARIDDPVGHATTDEVDAIDGRYIDGRYQDSGHDRYVLAVVPAGAVVGAALQIRPSAAEATSTRALDGFPSRGRPLPTGPVRRPGRHARAMGPTPASIEHTPPQPADHDAHLESRINGHQHSPSPGPPLSSAEPTAAANRTAAPSDSPSHLSPDHRLPRTVHQVSSSPHVPPAHPFSGTITVKLFGSPAILDTRGHPVAGLRKHAMSVLLYLALNPEGVDLSALHELLWADKTLSTARRRLSTEAANLRRTVRLAAGQPNNPAINAILNTGSHYRLADFLDIDIRAFEEAIDTAALWRNDPARRRQALERAVTLHTGRLADRSTIDHPWLRAPRRRLARTGARARLALADLLAADESATAAGPERVLALIREASRLDPDNPAIQERMSALSAQLTP